MIAIPEEEFAKLVRIKNAAKRFENVDTTIGAPVKWAELTKAIEELKAALE